MKQVNQQTWCYNMAQLPIGKFLTERLLEYDAKFELRKGTGFESLFFQPLQLIVQPLRDEANDIFIGQSFSRILSQADPNSFDEEVVDSLASNLLVYRRTGGQSSGTVRCYYNEPVDREYPATGAVFSANNGEVFTNPSPFKVTASEMSIAIEDGLYYFDIQVQSVNSGDAVNIEANGIVAFSGDTDFVRVTNKLAISGGVPREVNTDFITRAKNSIGTRDLLVGKGFNAILFENFPSILQEMQPIGLGDPEMMRDIVYNTHVGGRVDGYMKTFSIKQDFQNFVGVLIDPTRQAYGSTNVGLPGTAWISLKKSSIDRSNNHPPVVTQIKVASQAEFLNSVDLTVPVNLSSNQHIKIGIDGNFLNIRIAGINAAATSRNEIVNLINNAFGFKVAFNEGNTFRLRSPTFGNTSSIVLADPDVGNSTLTIVFGLSSLFDPYQYNGDGPIEFIEGVHYNIDDALGNIQRILGPIVLALQTTGNTTVGSDQFTDATPSIFLNVVMNDIISITTGSEPADYRVIAKIDNNTLQLDYEFLNTEATLSYEIRRSGIKDEEIVYAQFYYNPVSIDIGKYIILDTYGRVRGVRTGRELVTITDLILLRVRSIEIIDPLTKEPTGQILDGSGGYGQGGYGLGGYGVGSGAEWRIVVNLPTDRFSFFEDSFIILDSAYNGESVRVSYDYVPELEDVHNFVRSERERILDGDVLVKHFLPAYVQGTIQYQIKNADASTPTNEDLQTAMIGYINAVRAGETLEFSDIVQFITKFLDPYQTYKVFVKNFTLQADIHNTDGTVSRISGTETLTIPTLDPFPKDTRAPLSARITHWIADDLIMERI